tara:strand:- start:266 stop:499 length:234 start_codon:yes stop_codon:yes gene_type:complete
MKISEARIKEIIAEEKQRLLEEKKISGVQFALKEIAMQAAQLHDSKENLAKIDEKDLVKIKQLAESLDGVFYRLTNS